MAGMPALPTLENTLPMVLPYLMPVLMVAPRLLGLHIALPMFGPSSIPAQVRHSLSLSLALFLFPLAASQEPIEPRFFTFAAVALKEFFLGYAFGFPIALLTWAAQGAGDLVSIQSGASMASQFDPGSQTESSPMGLLLMRFAEVIFFLSGAYTFLLGALFDSYRIWPIASFFPELGAGGAAFYAAAFGKYFASACLMAFPAMACMFLITFCLALICRYVPQLNVFFLAMPIQCLTAVGVMILCIPIYAHMFDSHFAKILESLTGLDRIFGGR